jgi:DNA end-binding protein Ku
MSGAWKPGTYRDSFKEDIMALVKKKVAAGKTTEILSVDQVDEAPVSGKILDLTDLLKRSLKKGGGDAAPKPGSNIVTTLKPKRPTTQTKPPAARVKARVAKVKRPVHG